MRRIEGRDFKTHKGPRCQNHQAEYGVTVIDAIESKGREYLAHVDMRQTKERRYKDPSKEDHGEDRMQPLQNRLCHDEQHANTHQNE